ncbi:SusD/RagB family nutrient-binding outer membrane lipoprotein [Prolixibacteraceae bacterium Z1-6]|uniref:SusD/RagB family nutrient-binding outer membrane lipoprotein n=1 Tax=Draconibacterium aestuarii TaxID=2998507 RepID=A0A9X3FIA6_9BACT|nr:SusD/RagB family nutrient-binding outer membrane lipoprotein [Prolixibacteraceae bacterium Z1-6]
MNKIKNSFIIVLTFALAFVISCKDLDDLNVNPNGVDPNNADLNLLMPTIITKVGETVVSLGFGDIAGVMQHTQFDGWSSGHNDYDWDNQDKSWSAYYSILRNADEYHKKAIEGDYEFHQGVSLIFRAYTFGLITDLWGDAPYSEALKAEEGTEYFAPKFDDQKDIYLGILEDLETANTLLSKSSDDYKNVNNTQDVLYAGDVTKWRKLANSLALRYYMRLSEKEPSIAQAGINKITSDPSTYPLIILAEDDASVSYIGSSKDDDWPSNTVFDTSTSGTYMRNKLCSTLVDALQALNDPRLGVWANKIEIPLVLVSGEGIDRIVDGKREISQDIVDDYEAAWGVGIDYDSEYVGIPPSVFAASQYNLNPYLEQGVYNPHCSHLNDRYKETSGPLLLMRLMSAAEVNFILSEAALYGWISGNAEDYYAEGIKQSLTSWDVEGEFEDYIGNATFEGLESIITQKWIASWTAAAESWFDYRRTGLPDLQTGESAKREALPLRFYYHYDDEIAKNTANAEAAIAKLEPTQYKGSDVSNNSAWSKMWLLQGTNKPY